MAAIDAETEKADSSSLSSLYSLWSLQDSLLQNYRTMFLTAESLLIAVGSAIASSQKPLFSWPLITIGLFLCFIWLIVTWSRARDVRFAQTLLLRSEEGKSVLRPFTTFRDYKNARLQNVKYTISYVNGETEDFGQHGVLPLGDFSFQLFRPWHWGTRIHMEIVLPAMYILAWLVVIYYAIPDDFIQSCDSASLFDSQGGNNV